MKNIVLISFVIILITAFCSCENMKIGNSDNLRVRIPTTYFVDMSEKDISLKAQNRGYLSCSIDDNGYVIYVMTRITFEEEIKNYKREIEDIFFRFLYGEERIDSFLDINYNEDFSKINILVSPEKYNKWDELCLFEIYSSIAFYQVFMGVDESEIDITVNFINDETREIITTSSFDEI